MEDKHRQTLLKNQSSLERTSQSLARSHRIATETEVIGTEVVTELGSQREALLRARNRMADTDMQLSEAHRILTTLRRQIFTNKLLLIFIIIVEFLILCSQIYFKFLRKIF